MYALSSLYDAAGHRRSKIPDSWERLASFVSFGPHQAVVEFIRQPAASVQLLMTSCR